MNKLLLICIVASLSACVDDTQPQDTQPQVDQVLRCPENSECEDNRIDAAMARSYGAAERAAAQAQPGSPTTRIGAWCNNAGTVCGVQLDFVLFDFSFDCHITLDSGGTVTSVDCHYDEPPTCRSCGPSGCVPC